MSTEYESAAEKLNAMMEGTFDYGSEEEQDSGSEQIEEDVVDETTNEETEQEETEYEEESEESETTDQIDGDDQDTEEDDEDEYEDESVENTPVNDGEDETASNEDVNTDESEEKVVEPESDGEPVNYQAKYDELLTQSEKARNFYDVATSQFKANGKMVKGFTDPNKIIESQQMLHGFEGKMQVFKKHKPFLRALQEQGMVEDTAKFDLAMNIASGDKEAFKQHAKNQGWDLLDMDTDSVDYGAQTHVSSPMAMAYDDLNDNAKSHGVQSKVNDLVNGSWDEGSVIKLLDSPKDSSIIVSHMESGIYDAVQARISEKKLTDVSGGFSGESNYNQYMVASRELEGEYQNHIQKEREYQSQASNAQVAKENELIRAEEEKKQSDYKDKLASKEDEAKKARAKANSMSKPKAKPRRVKKKSDKMSLTGDAFQNYFNKEILGMN